MSDSNFQQNSQVGNDEFESVKILIQENLFEEAKHVLFRLLIRINDPQSFTHRRAKELLNKIETMELHELMNKTSRSKINKDLEDSTSLILKLEKDLELDSFEDLTPLMEEERWTVNESSASTQGFFDLAVAFYEMGCFGDALRELKKAEKKIRIEESFLGELGVSIVALHAQSLICLGHAFKAKIYLEPILVEPDLPHEQKIILYYTMGLAEQVLEEKKSAHAWFKKVAEADPDFKDVQQRIRSLQKTT